MKTITAQLVVTGYRVDTELHEGILIKGRVTTEGKLNSAVSREVKKGHNELFKSTSH